MILLRLLTALFEPPTPTSDLSGRGAHRRSTHRAPPRYVDEPGGYQVEELADRWRITVYLSSGAALPLYEVLLDGTLLRAELR